MKNSKAIKTLKSFSEKSLEEKIKEEDDPPSSILSLKKEKDEVLSSFESKKKVDFFLVEKNKLQIVLAFNYHNKKKYGLVSDEFDTPETIELIKKAVESQEYKVYLIEGDENFYSKIKNLKEKNKVDFVFNYSVGIYGRSREAHIPAICEMLRIPYGASDVLTTALCQDKVRAKELLSYYGIKTPPHQLFRTPNEKLVKRLNFPLIVKYVYQGSSIGLKDGKSVVNSEAELYKRLKSLYQAFPQTIIAEEYIKGREFTVGFYGNLPSLTFFPLVEMKPTKDQNPNNWVFNSRNQPVFNKVSIDLSIKEKIYGICKKIIEIFELRDWGRIDLRVEEDNEVYILEINNCAHLSTKSVYFMGAKALGLTHNQLIARMLNSTLKRYNLI